MVQYIDKFALVAEIEKRKGMCDNHYGDYWNGCYNTFTDILSFIDTLEVKEVDLEKPFEGIKIQTSMESGSLNEIILTTKYKAQKGEL